MKAEELLQLYPVPSELVSEEQRDRFVHGDLPTLTIQDLKRELAVLRFLNFFGDSAWHLEREVLVESELSSRGRKKR